MGGLKKEFPTLADASAEEIVSFLQHRQKQLAASPPILNRREAARINIEHMMMLEFNGVQICRYTLDISTSGAKIVGTCPIEMHARLAIDLNNQNQWGAAVASVVRIEPDAFGIRFLFKTAEFDAILKDMVGTGSID